MNDSKPSSSRLLKAYATIAKWSLWLLLTAWLVFALAWGALHGWIVPRIGDLRPDLEIEAQRILGVPVRIGSVSANNDTMIPSFELRDVALLDAQGREALKLPRVVVGLSPRSLWNLGFEQMYIDGPVLDIRRAADGRIHVAGLDFSRDAGDNSRATDWFFNQTEFVVHNGTVRWTDEMRNAPPLALARVDLVMRNSARRHAMRLDATPPPEWGDRFSLRGVFRQPLLSVHHGRWQDWDGQVYGDFARVDVSQLRRHANLGFEVSQGSGAVRTWADVVKGQVTGGTADLQLANVSTRLSPQLEPLALRSVSGRLGGRRLGTGFEFETQGLQFDTQDGLHWPGGNVFVKWADADGKTPVQGEIKADKLDLLALSQIASRLPLGTATHSALAAYKPRGLVETLQARWRGPIDNLAGYEAKGRASALEVASRPGAARPGGVPPAAGTPGVRGASLDFDFTQAGGKGRLAVDKGALDLPGVFEDPVVLLDQLSADLQWKIDGEQISASIGNLKFANADAQGDGQVSWRTSDTAGGKPRFPGVLDLQAGISRAQGTRVWRYLPLGVPKPTRDYVQEAVQQGSASGAKFRVKGNLRDFPFAADPKLGEFRISANVQNATYAYVPRSISQRTNALPWPALTQLSGELIFDRGGMEVKNASGRFLGSNGLSFKADAQIPELKASVIGVNGQVKGPLAEALAIVNGSPLSPMMGQALAKATATGDADVKLKLALPLAQIEKSKVSGSVTLAGSDLQITPDSPMLARARGLVTFNENGFWISGAQARALGGELRLEGGNRQASQITAADAPIQLRAQGTVTAEGLRQARELGFLARLAKDATGGAAYTAVLGFRKGASEILVQSNLQGLGLALPAPLNKAADAQLPLRFETALRRESLAASGPGSPVRLQDQLSLDIGRIASIVYVRDISGPEPRVIRGSIAVGLAPGESAQVVEQGVSANINLSGVNIDAWEDALSAAAGPATGNASLRATTPNASATAALSYLPTVIAVRAKDLTVEGRTLHNVVVGGSRDGLTWRANLDATELNGYLEYRQPSGAGAGRVFARLARLNIAASEATQVEALLDEQPTNIPALDIVVEDFELRGKKLGRVEIDAVNRGAGTVARDGGAREWRLNKLNITLPEAVFTASGNWAALDAQAATPAPATTRPGAKPVAERRRTAMKFRLDIADSGQLLNRFGMKDVIRRGKGRMEGQVSWLGSPLSMDHPSMSGAFNVNVESGQFLKADPGLAKLLGVLSLQSLPRRLTLDFRDVFSEGFAFDFVRGDVTIQQGIAATNNLQMKGVNAAVLMEGRADIAKETQDLKVVVVPEINAGTASLVAAAINPVIGLSTILAQLFLRQPLIRAATQEFHIDGTWADPRITKVDRKAAAEPPASPGAPATSRSGAGN